MSKVPEIERRIQELEGGAFQRLANSYLRRLGYGPINALGSLVGSQKTRKGTPDAFVVGSNGKYTFVESTTQTDGLATKLQGDLEKCLTEKKTAIPVEEIEEVVICHTGQLDPGEHRQLLKWCKGALKLRIYGVHEIALDLAERYPGIARDHLGIAIDTGQILEPEDFVSTYGKSAIRAPLDTGFHGRDTEVEEALEALAGDDILIVTGPAGVGKTRVALEVVRRFCGFHPEFEAWCVLDRGHNLFDDLRAYFSDAGSFLLLADDANRLTDFDRSPAAGPERRSSLQSRRNRSRLCA